MAALTIAFVPGVSPAKWARVWRQRFPDIALELMPVAEGAVSAALDGAADMAFARLPLAVPPDHAIPLWTETAVVATPKDSLLAAITDVTEEDLAAVTVLDHGPVPADIDATLDLVEANVGVAVLPHSLLRAQSRKALVARPLVGAAGTQIALVWMDAADNTLVDEFIGIVRGRTANSSRGPEVTAPSESAAPAKAHRRAQPGNGQSPRRNRTTRGRRRGR